MSRIGDQRLRIEARLVAVRDDHRASYLFDTKAAADALRLSPNKFGTWWQRTDAKLFELAVYQPAAFAAEFFSIAARAALERDRRMERAQLDQTLHRGGPP